MASSRIKHPYYTVGILVTAQDINWESTGKPLAHATGRVISTVVMDYKDPKYFKDAMDYMKDVCGKSVSCIFFDSLNNPESNLMMSKAIKLTIGADVAIAGVGEQDNRNIVRPHIDYLLKDPIGESNLDKIAHIIVHGKRWTPQTNQSI